MYDAQKGIFIANPLPRCAILFLSFAGYNALYRKQERQSLVNRQDFLACFRRQVKSLVKEALFMHIFLMILSACLIIIFTLALIILLLPLHYKLSLQFIAQTLQYDFSLGSCCYGLHANKKDKQGRAELRLFAFRWPLKQSVSANEMLQPAPGRKKSFSLHSLKKLVQKSALKDHLWGLTKDIWRIIRPHRMLVNARIGFSEPHYTGWLMAVAGMLQASHHAYHIQLEGVWDETCLEGELVIAGWLMPVQLLWQLLKFILKPEIRAAYKQFKAKQSLSPQQAAA